MSVGVALERAANLELPGALKTLHDSDKLTATGLVLDDPTMGYEEFEQVAHDIAEFRKALGKLTDMTQFWAGDLIEQGSQLFDEDQEYQAFEALDLSPGALQDWSRVARLVPREERRQELRWSHHRMVATRKPEERVQLLQTAVDSSLSTTGFREYLQDLDAQLKAGDETARGGGEGARYETGAVVVEHVVECAQRVFHQGQVIGDVVHIPIEPWRQLAAALGEE